MGELIKVKENNWRYQTETRLLEFSFIGKEFGYWDGPLDETARSHEGGGGVMPIEKAVQFSSVKLEYPEFYTSFCKLIDDYLGK